MHGEQDTAPRGKRLYDDEGLHGVAALASLRSNPNSLAKPVIAWSRNGCRTLQPLHRGASDSERL
jgi:hypothetical protein